MSKESYVRGFCKTAEAAGVDPQALAKFAAVNFDEKVFDPSKFVSGLNDASNLRRSLKALGYVSSRSPSSVLGLASLLPVAVGSLPFSEPLQPAQMKKPGNLPIVR